MVMNKKGKRPKLEYLYEWIETPLGIIITAVFLILFFGLSMKAIRTFLFPLI